jgi:hypothetical protein
MARRRVATAVSAFAALAASAALAVAAPPAPPAPSAAGPAAVDLRVECPALDVETRALFEARARADLVAEALPRGGVAIVCTATQATLTWAPSGAAIRERAVTLPAESAGTVDVLLAGMHDLLAEESPDAAAPDAGGLDAAPSPDAAPVEASAFDIADAGVLDASALPAPRSSEPAVVAGVDAELWRGGVAGALGGHAGARLRLAEQWHASLLAGPLFGLGDADGAHALAVRVIARVDYQLVPHLEVALGADGRVVWASSARSAAQKGATAGLQLGARLSAPLGPIALSLCPTLEALARPVVIEVDDVEAFRVPSLLAGLSIEAAYR